MIAVLVAVLSASGSHAERVPQSSPLTRVGAIVRLSAADAERGVPVRVEGTVVYSDAAWGLLFIQDDSGLVLADPLGLDEVPPTGARILVTGTTGQVRRAPAIVHPETRQLGVAELPRAPFLVGAPGSATRLGPAWVELEGVVRSISFEPDRSMLRLSASGEAVEVHVPVSPTAKSRPLVDARVRVRGVIEKAAGASPALRLWSPSWAQMTQLTPSSDPLSRPIIPIAEVRRLWSEGLLMHRVRIQGRIVRRESARSFLIEDDTGTVEAEPPAPEGIQPDTRLELWGFAESREGKLRLVDTTERFFGNRATAVLRREAGLPPIERTSDLRTLSKEEAERGHAVSLRAVVTFVDPAQNALFIQDAHGAVFVHTAGRDLGVGAGQLILVEGVTAPGNLAPIVVEPRVRILGPAPLPEPVAVSATRLVTGEDDCRRVEVTGIVRAVVERPDGRVELKLVTEGLALQVFVAAEPDRRPATRVVDARVRLRGVCATSFNWRGVLQGVAIQVPRPEDLEVLSVPEAAPSGMPRTTLGEVLRTRGADSWGHRVLVEGVVLFHEPGRSLALRDPSGTAWVDARDRIPLFPGDKVRAAGFPAATGFAAALEDAQLRLVARAPRPEPRAVAAGSILSGIYDSELVTIRARLLSLTRSEELFVLLLQSGETVFAASVGGAVSEMPALAPDSVLDVTGVCVMRSAARPATSFRIQLRTAADLRVVAEPPWWTPSRTQWALSGLGAVLAGAFAWVVTLRRRVRIQTAALRERLEREAELERDYRDRLEAMVWDRTRDLERAQEELIRKERLATLGQLTATVSHELRNPLGTIRGSIFFVADSLRDAQPAIRRALDRAERNIGRCDAIIEELLEYARVRDLVREPTDLDAWLQEALGEIHLPPGIVLDRAFASRAQVSIDRQRLLRCIINLVTNATEAVQSPVAGKPPRGSRIEVSSRVAAERAEVRVADDGPGISPEVRQRIFEPFFSTKSFGVGLGLSIVQQIMEQHGGGVTAESEPGRTVLTLWLGATTRGEQPTRERA